MGISLDQWRRSIEGGRPRPPSEISKQQRRDLKDANKSPDDTTTTTTTRLEFNFPDIYQNSVILSVPLLYLLLFALSVCGYSTQHVFVAISTILQYVITGIANNGTIIGGCIINELLLYFIRKVIGICRNSNQSTTTSSGGSTTTSSNNVVSQATSSSTIATTSSSFKLFVASLFWPVNNVSALSSSTISSPKSVWSIGSIVMIGVLVGVYFVLMSGSGERRSSRRTSASGGGLQRDIESQMEDDTSTNKRKSTSPPAGSAASDGKPLRQLKDLLFSEKLEKKIDEIKEKHASGDTKKTKTGNNDIAVDLEKVILKYIPILMCCNDKSEVYEHYYEFRASILAVLEKVPGYGRDMINMGEDLCDDTLALL